LEELSELDNSENQTDAHSGVATHEPTQVLFDFEGSPIASGDPIVDVAHFLFNLDRNKVPVGMSLDEVIKVINHFDRLGRSIPLSKFPKAAMLYSVLSI